jgi:cytochrome c biogenesis protein CcmG, thiol:disulfide interchange protein DsbE
MPRLITVIVIGVAFGGLLYAATRQLGGDAQPSVYVIGSPAAGMQVGQIAPGSAQAPGSPRLALSDVDGAPVALSDFAGRPVWLIFWKMACQPCEAEAPDITAAYAEHRSDGLVILGINAWDTVEDVRDYASEHSLKYPIAIDPAGSFIGAYGVWGAPTHYFIDSTGIIEARQFGPMTRDLIEESLHRIL